VLMEPSFVKGYNTVQQCITFIMVPLKVKVTSSMYGSLLYFRKVVWNVWCNFLHPNDVFNDATNTKIPFPNVHSLVVHYPMPVHFQQWPTSWTFSPGMIIHSIDHGEKLPPTTQQLSTVMHFCHMIPADHTSSHSILIQECCSRLVDIPYGAMLWGAVFCGLLRKTSIMLASCELRIYLFMSI
jgi:hypothetical protein